ncbi:MAG: hypothetical protein IPI88_12605 [Chitinophagaceae bacterium]|nr:hypothetical protein [Chitinophagaceae bacterium]
MKRNISIQLKAALLLVVFALNTLVGFACAVGVDMSFNTSHHEEEERAIAVHVHAGGKKHHHEEAEHKHKHNDKKDDCCSDKVVKLSQTDKAVPQAAKIVSPVFFTAFVAVYYNIDISYPSQVNTFNKYYVRGHHPPIPDIRIAIKSFQI